jgi:hypothetical protein
MRDFCLTTEKTTNMEEKKLTYRDIPTGYSLCFNDECTKKACCMHYQAQLLMPKGRVVGPAVYPTAWQDGDCKCFREKRLVRHSFRPLRRGLGLRVSVIFPSNNLAIPIIFPNFAQSITNLCHDLAWLRGIFAKKTMRI